jgi:hypothetical protein
MPCPPQRERVLWRNEEEGNRFFAEFRKELEMVERELAMKVRRPTAGGADGAGRRAGRAGGGGRSGA